jgi:hypothetical protein
MPTLSCLPTRSLVLSLAEAGAEGIDEQTDQDQDADGRGGSEGEALGAPTLDGDGRPGRASSRNRFRRGRPSAFSLACSSVGMVKPTADAQASAISSGVNTLVARAYTRSGSVRSARTSNMQHVGQVDRLAPGRRADL